MFQTWPSARLGRWYARVNTESLPNWRTMIEQFACTQDHTASGVKHVANISFGHATRRFQAV